MKTTKVKTLEFFLLLTVFFILLFFLFKSPPMLYAGIVIALIGLVSGKVSYWIYLGWMKFSQFLAYIMTHLILSIVFFLVLFPISLFYRMANKDALKLKANKYPSLFDTRSKQFTASDIENMW